jgi:type VI secretion system protein VasD
MTSNCDDLIRSGFEMCNRLLKICFCLVLLFNLSGCETTKKIFEVISDPNVPVGYPSDNPTEVTLTFLSDEDINQNQEGEATPIELQVIYLNEDSHFLSANYDQLLIEGPEKTLGKNYIDHQDYTLLPDQYKILPSFQLSEKTRFIGVVAHYGDIDNSYWADVAEVEAIGKKATFLIHIKTNEVSIKKEEK